LRHGLLHARLAGDRRLTVPGWPQQNARQHCQVDGEERGQDPDPLSTPAPALALGDARDTRRVLTLSFRFGFFQRVENE
jgi:hypothetical protein